MKETLDEDALELAYWSFDTERKRNGMERDAFKGQMRKFAKETLKKYGCLPENEAQRRYGSD